MFVGDLILTALLLSVSSIIAIALFRRKSFKDVMREMGNELRIIDKLYTEGVENGEGILVVIKNPWDILMSNPSKIKFYLYDEIKPKWKKIKISRVGPVEDFEYLDLQDFNLSQVQSLNQNNKYIPMAHLFIEPFDYIPLFHRKYWCISLYPRPTESSFEDVDRILGYLDNAYR